MFKKIHRKKTAVAVTTPVTQTQQKTCGACGHQRKPADSNPDWQCPGCGAAYVKVNAAADSGYSRQELRDKNHAYLKQRAAAEASVEATEQEHHTLTGFVTGIGSFVSGLGSACAAANPLVQVAGVAIILGSIVYGLVKFLS